MWRCRVARGGALAVWGRTTGHAPVGSFGCLRPVEPWRAPCKAKSGHVLLAWGIWPAVRGRSGCHLSTRALGARLGDWCRVLGLAGGALAVWGGTTEHIDVRRLCIHPPRGGSYRASLGGCTGADSPRRCCHDGAVSLCSMFIFLDVVERQEERALLLTSYIERVY